jgi:hypothetical protein
VKQEYANNTRQKNCEMNPEVQKAPSPSDLVGDRERTRGETERNESTDDQRFREKTAATQSRPRLHYSVVRACNRVHVADAHVPT